MQCTPAMPAGVGFLSSRSPVLVARACSLLRHRLGCQLHPCGSVEEIQCCGIGPVVGFVCMVLWTSSSAEA